MADILTPTGLTWQTTSTPPVQAGSGSHTDIDEPVGGHDADSTRLASVHDNDNDAQTIIVDVHFGPVVNVQRIVGRVVARNIITDISASQLIVQFKDGAESLFGVGFGVHNTNDTYLVYSTEFLFEGGATLSNATLAIEFRSNINQPSDNTYITAVDLVVYYTGEGYETHISKLQRMSIPPRENHFFYHWLEALPSWQAFHFPLRPALSR